MIWFKIKNKNNVVLIHFDELKLTRPAIQLAYGWGEFNNFGKNAGASIKCTCGDKI
jgi:hypothetical protein